MGSYLVGEAVGCLQAAATAIAKGGTLSVQVGYQWCLLLLSHVLFAFWKKCVWFRLGLHTFLKAENYAVLFLSHLALLFGDEGLDSGTKLLMN